MSPWLRSATRRGILSGTSGLLNAANVHDDDSHDKLTGGSGLDWFFANLTGGPFLDVITDLRDEELLFEL